MTMNPAALANPRAISVRLKAVNKSKAAGQRRHDLRIGKQPKYVDEKRANLNRHLIEAKTAAELVTICDERRKSSGVERKRKVASNVAVATIGIITFGREAQRFMEDLTDEQQDALFTEVANRVTERLGTSVTGLSVHLDEAGLHAHFQGAATSIYGGPVSRISTKNVLNEIQTIAAEVAQQYDQRIERGNRKLDRIDAGADYADTIHKTVKQMHETLVPERDELITANEAAAATLQKTTASIADLSITLEDINRQIAALNLKKQTQEDRLKKQQDKLQENSAKLDQKQTTLTKTKKLVATYEGRVKTSEAELERLQRRLEATEAAIGDLQTQRLERDALEASLAPLRAAVEAVEAHEASEGLRIAATETAAIRKQVEDDLAAQLTDPEWLGETATAILIAEKKPDWLDHQWDLEDFVKGLGLKAPSHDFAKVLQEFKETPKVYENIRDEIRANSPTVMEHAVNRGESAEADIFSIHDVLEKFGSAVKNTNGVARLRENQPGWRRVFRGFGEIVETLFARLSEKLTAGKIQEIAKPAPPPPEAKPLLDLPEPEQEKVRAAFVSPTDPSL